VRVNAAAAASCCERGYVRRARERRAGRHVRSTPLPPLCSVTPLPLLALPCVESRTAADFGSSACVCVCVCVCSTEAGGLCGWCGSCWVEGSRAWGFRVSRVYCSGVSGLRVWGADGVEGMGCGWAGAPDVFLGGAAICVLIELMIHSMAALIAARALALFGGSVGRVFSHEMSSHERFRMPGQG